MPNKDKIEEILKKNLKVHHIEVVDESHKHAGHNPAAASGGTHMQIVIISDDFKNRSRIDRHKMVYKILEDDIRTGLHAITIKTLTIEESSSQQ